jgi:molybdate transport system substrate-binding protein
MDTLRQGNLIKDAPRSFARNQLAIIVPTSNPAKLERVEDLNRQGLKIVIAAANVPVGSNTRQLIENFRHDAAFGPEFPTNFYDNVVSQEMNVRQVLSKVTLGEADAGIVFATDALSAKDKVIVLDMPEGLNVTAEYPLTILNPTKDSNQAQQFIEFVLSPQGQAVLAQYGFLPAR